MKTKQILKVCDKCLCNICNDEDCKEGGCSVCDLKYPIKDCGGYRGEIITNYMEGIK